MEQVWLKATLWFGLALVSSILAMRTRISVAMMEILVGILAGNFLHIDPHQEWIQFLAGLGSVLLTFMAGAEIEPKVLKRYLKESLIIGFLAFLFPFSTVMLFAHYIAHWDWNAAKISGIALSTTSVAIVYAVMVETGYNETPLGKVILAACFVNDLGTVLALGVLFANYNAWLALFVGASILVLGVIPGLSRKFFQSFNNHVSEPEIKWLLFFLLFLGWLATRSNSEAVLPAYLMGLVTASLLSQQRTLVRHLRTLIFAVFTPFYFLKAGILVSLSAMIQSLLLIGLLLGVKMLSKFAGVFPTTYFLGFTRRCSWYTTLLSSTGLTFGTISALFGYTRGIINQAQYTACVIAVIGSAIVPTLIAQTFFRPTSSEMEHFGKSSN